MSWMSFTKMRYRQLIDDPTFLKEKIELQNKITHIQGNLRDTETRAEKWLELLPRKLLPLPRMRGSLFCELTKWAKQG